MPQRWFAHFYAIGAIWNFLVLLAFRAVQDKYIVNVGPTHFVVAALSVLQVHLVRRLLETMLLLKYPAQARMHGIAYIFSLTYVLKMYCSGKVRVCVFINR